MAILCSKNNGYYNFIFSNGEKSLDNVESSTEERKIESAVKRILLFYDTDSLIFGFELYDKDGACLFAEGYESYKTKKIHETIL